MSRETLVDSRRIIRAVDAETTQNFTDDGAQDFDQSDYIEVTGNGTNRKVNVEAKNDGEANDFNTGLQLQGGLVVKAMEETVEADGSAAYDLGQDIPAGAVILSAQLNLDTIVTATTAVKVGLGITGDEDKYGKTAVLTADAKADTIPDWAVLASGEDIQVFAVDTAGDDAGTLDTGTIRVRITYAELESLPDAS